MRARSLHRHWLAPRTMTSACGSALGDVSRAAGPGPRPRNWVSRRCASPHGGRESEARPHQAPAPGVVHCAGDGSAAPRLNQRRAEPLPGPVRPQLVDHRNSTRQRPPDRTPRVALQRRPHRRTHRPHHVVARAGDMPSSSSRSSRVRAA